MEELRRNKNGTAWWANIPTPLIKIGYYRSHSFEEQDDEAFEMYVVHVIALRYAVHLSLRWIFERKTLVSNDCAPVPTSRRTSRLCKPSRTLSR